MGTCILRHCTKIVCKLQPLGLSKIVTTLDQLSFIRLYYALFCGCQRAVVKLLDYLQRLATRQAAAVPAPVSRSPSVAEPPPEKVMLWSDWFKKQVGYLLYF